MKILLYGINYAPELTGIGKYSGEMGDWLAARGHEVRVISAPPYYPEWRVGSGYSGWSYRRETLNNVGVLRCPLFVPQRPTTLTRLLHLASFALTSLPAVLSQWRWKPDLIITIEPTFFCVPAGLLLSRLTGAKSILHIQDFELDAMLGLGMAKNGRLKAKIFQAVENFFMRRFSAISSISHSMLARAGNKTRQLVPLHFFPNWVDTDFIKPGVDASDFRRRWALSDTSQIVLYSGNLGKKQGLDLLLQAAKHLSSESDVVFLVLGEGAEKQNLIEQAKRLELHNIRFEPLQPYEDLPALMALADVHLVIQRKGAADAVLPSKLTTILAAGGYALITAEAETELGILCERYPGIAERVEPENLEQFLGSLKSMLHAAKAGRPHVNMKARQYALEKLGKEAILQNFEEILLGLASKNALQPANTKAVY
ncbi:glycosyltransferase WbuB [Candidatus Methylomicrobium oryzae]|jgi:colanic acid biosynthesis glycosyl transferase WcaI|uniref:glycosyltransferase WbuB n=1 Tax=Candidatus Methylomicrobium oryzae TaxID=2802053 RepID=UPI0019251645|nr:glycosyltransferase WbuB [Methylomicrobium sp. RS1]MBL1262368.1 glycosyltransferase WbuB [Methylomicrobium sp. RS1]